MANGPNNQDTDKENRNNQDKMDTQVLKQESN